MVIAMVIYPNVRHQSEGIKIVVETKMLYYRKIKSCCYGNVISNVPDKKVIAPKPASRQGELDTPPMKKFARGRSVFFS
jgi:hypothetical protein